MKPCELILHGFFNILFMPTFANIAESFDFDFDRFLKKVFTLNKVKQFIVDAIWGDIYLTGKIGKKQTELVTNTALNQKRFAGSYSDTTVEIKESKGQKTKNVTLSDTGALKFSTKVKSHQKYAEIKAEFKKKDGDGDGDEDETVFDNFSQSFGSRDEFENQVLELTEQRFEELLEKYILDELTYEIENSFK